MFFHLCVDSQAEIFLRTTRFVEYLKLGPLYAVVALSRWLCWSRLCYLVKGQAETSPKHNRRDRAAVRAPLSSALASLQLRQPVLPALRELLKFPRSSETV